MPEQSSDEIISTVVTDILSQLPKPFDHVEALQKYPMDYHQVTDFASNEHLYFTLIYRSSEFKHSSTARNG